ncbi:MAG: cytochrome c [Caldilineales bacterium]|nr:cytochrome c [Caldilineales bacterium]
MQLRTLLAFITFSFILVACAIPADLTTPIQVLESTAQAESQPESTPTARPGMGMGSGMFQRHHAVVPEAYAGLENPAADAESIARGQAVYEANCLSCHGSTGMGEAPAGQALNPVAAPIAHTSQMMTDGYLFWRISEGGQQFATAMPAWGEALPEQERWDVINYVRALGSGSVQSMGAGPMAGMDEAAHRSEMLANAVAQGAITAEDAELFERVHRVLDEHYRAGETNMGGMGAQGMALMQRAFTEQAVRDGRISQEEAAGFTAIHDLLLEQGLMQ